MYIRLEHRGLDNDWWLDATPEAFVVHCWALDYCNEQATDGFIPERRAHLLICPIDRSGLPAAWANLVETGRWQRVEGGYQCSEFLGYGLAADEQDATHDKWNTDKRRRKLCGLGVHMLCTARSRCPVIGRRSGTNSTSGGTDSTSSGTDSTKSGGLDQTKPNPQGFGGSGGRGGRSAGATRPPQRGEMTPHPWHDNGQADGPFGLGTCLCGATADDLVHRVKPHDYLEPYPDDPAKRGETCAVCGAPPRAMVHGDAS
jgi:hypothetical protein